MEEKEQELRSSSMLFSTSHQPSSQLRRRKWEEGHGMLNGNSCNIGYHWRLAPLCHHRNPKQTKQVTVQMKTSLHTSAVPLSAKDVDMKDDEDGNISLEDVAAPAFIIQPISRSPINDEIFRRISSLCIDVFFKELLDPSGNGNINFVKEWQISYLKGLQAADLRRRRDRYEDTNEMFLAYEVKRVTGLTAALSQPSLLLDEDLTGVYNLEKISRHENNIIRKDDIINEDDSDYYVRGDLLGFVEITQRPYGLGFDGAFGGNNRHVRSVLTNLAVLKAARRYGIGSKLLDACEKHVRKEWKMNEIILEVEDYNTKGLEFYRQRGYEVLFSDPASRRYDVQGLWLKKIRCKRQIMRKRYVDYNGPIRLLESADSIVRKIRETVGNF